MRLSIHAGPRRRTRRALIAAVLPLVVAAVALPSAAQAGSISYFGGNLGFTDVSGNERNDVLLRVVGNDVVITDGVPISPLPIGTPCRFITANQVACVSQSVTNVNVSTGGGDDTVEYRLPHAGQVRLGVGADRIRAGTRAAVGRAIQPVSYIGGRSYNDLAGGFVDEINYVGANRGVHLNFDDGLANDGRPGDRENVDKGFRRVMGSQFNDVILGSDRPETYHGNHGNDSIGGGLGDDTFVSFIADGADDYHGGPGRDTMDYRARTIGVAVSSDNLANDGQSGERDNVRSNIESLLGGSGGDVFDSLGAHSQVLGYGGNDTMRGGDGPDYLWGGPGRDNIDGGRGNDVIDSRDGELDTIDCSAGTDTLLRDNQERRIAGCETITVGTLKLTPKSARAAAGKTTRLRLSWRHPKAWKKLRTIELRLTHDHAPVGTLTVRARGNRVTDGGAISVLRKASRVTRNGKTVTARLAMRLDSSVAGARLKAHVEATDARGRRQLETNAATIRVAG